jgi:hypothetical protein
MRYTQQKPRDRSVSERAQDQADWHKRKEKRDVQAELKRQELTSGTYNSLEDLIKLQVLNTLYINTIIDVGTMVAQEPPVAKMTEREAAIHRTNVLNLKDLLTIERGIRDLASKVAADGVQSHTIGAAFTDEAQLAMDEAELTLTKLNVRLEPVPTPR